MLQAFLFLPRQVPNGARRRPVPSPEDARTEIRGHDLPRPGKRELLADVGHQRHEAGAFDGILDGALKGGAVAAAFAAEQFALAGAELFERLHVLVINERRPRASFFGAEPAAILSAPSELLANHR